MAEKITLESLDARMDKSDARLDRIEADVGTLKSDVGTLKSDVGTLKSQMVEVTVGVHRLQADLDLLADVPETLADLTLNAKTMSAAVMEALTQLNLSRTYEKRLANLEAAVFGKPD
jgi:hypothetical protein